MSKSNIFGPAVNILQNSKDGIFGPEPFVDYLTKYKLKSVNTSSLISVDHFELLNHELKNNNCMVFRLGSSIGSKSNKTLFALAKTKKDWNDYFLIDDEIFYNCKEELYDLNESDSSIEVFKLLPKMTESSYLSLAVNSGVLAKALRLDDLQKSVTTATSRGSHFFNVKPHQEIKYDWIHQNGQVEIDSMFIAKRNNQDCLFIIEAKQSKKLSSIAKHKLVYPILAVRNTLKIDLQIVPVYLRAIRSDNQIYFYICECFYEKTSNAISTLKPVYQNVFKAKLA